jgi:carbamoyltransferase
VEQRFSGITACPLPDLYLGPGFDSSAVAAAIQEAGIAIDTSGAEGSTQPAAGAGIRVRRMADPSAETARLLLAGEIVLWFQGRMEIGPRALGHRSILARPDETTLKDRLNLLLKKRVWYQPFCPSLLREDAEALLETAGQEIADNRFMTMGFQVRPERRSLMAAVINVDGSCRPQFVGPEEPRYRSLLLEIKEVLGYGVLLNTSMNLHGEPMICTPGEAIAMLRRTRFRYLVMEDWLLENTSAVHA